MHDDRLNAGAARPARGRPRKDPGKARTQRVVTFVTESQRAQLEKLALQSDHSLSFIVYRMIAAQLKKKVSG